MQCGPAAPTSPQPQCGACCCPHNGARLQRPHAVRRISSCRYMLMESMLSCGTAGIVSGVRRQRSHQRQQVKAESSRAACTVIASRHSSRDDCQHSIGSVPPRRMLRCSSVSSGPPGAPACRHQPHRCQTHTGGPQRDVVARASLDATVQDVLMGGSVAIAIGMALFYGSKGEPQVCEGCGGAGGVRCFACDGTGVMASTDDEATLSPAQQRKGLVGGGLRPRAPRRGECRACRGSGLLVCKRCNGSGYSKRM